MRALAALLAAASIAGCTGRDPDRGSSVDTRHATPAGPGSPTPERRSVTVPLGKRVDGPKFSVVVREVTRRRGLGELNASNDEYLLGRVAIKNTTRSERLDVSGLSIALEDDRGARLRPTIVSTDHVLEARSLLPGEVSRGDVVFDAPDGTRGAALTLDFGAVPAAAFGRVTVDLSRSAPAVEDVTQRLRVSPNEVGSGVSVGGLEVVVDGVEFRDEIDPHTTAATGTEFALVDVATTNDTGGPVRVSAVMQMGCKDGRGLVYPPSAPAMLTLDRTYATTRLLEDGGALRGTAVYEVADGERPLYWLFEFGVSREVRRAIWRLR